MLVVGVLIIKKVIMKSRPSPAVQLPEKGAKVNENFQDDFELSAMT